LRGWLRHRKKYAQIYPQFTPKIFPNMPKYVQRGVYFHNNISTINGWNGVLVEIKNP
jgi:hypothetical protein